MTKLDELGSIFVQINTLLLGLKKNPKIILTMFNLHQAFAFVLFINVLFINSFTSSDVCAK